MCKGDMYICIQFYPVSRDWISKTLSSTIPKSCNLDLIPTALLRKYPSAMPLLCFPVNWSLANSTMPDDHKTPHVQPRLKKNFLDHDQLKNYRLVSNFFFISKMTKKNRSRSAQRPLLHQQHRCANAIYKQSRTLNRNCQGARPERPVEQRDTHVSVGPQKLVYTFMCALRACGWCGPYLYPSESSIAFVIENTIPDRSIRMCAGNARIDTAANVNAYMHKIV